MFTFNEDNQIIYRPDGVPQWSEGDFNSERELMKLADQRAVSRDGLQAVYDGLVAEGLAEPCKRMRNRPYAVAAIWKAIQAKDPSKPVAKPELVANGRMHGAVPVPVAPKDHKRKTAAPEPIAPAARKPAVPPLGLPETTGNRKKAAKVSKAKPSGNDRATARKPRAASRQREGFRPGTKAAEALSMLQRGVSNQELVEKLGWQKHTVRGFISTLQSKHKIKVETKQDEQRGLVYKTA